MSSDYKHETFSMYSAIISEIRVLSSALSRGIPAPETTLSNLQGGLSQV